MQPAEAYLQVATASCGQASATRRLLILLSHHVRACVPSA